MILAAFADTINRVLPECLAYRNVKRYLRVTRELLINFAPETFVKKASDNTDAFLYA